MHQKVSRLAFVAVILLSPTILAARVDAGELVLVLKDLTGDPLPEDGVVTFEDSTGLPIQVTRKGTPAPSVGNRFTVRGMLDVVIDPNKLVQPIPGRNSEVDKSVVIRLARASNQFQATNSLSAIVGNADDVQKIVVAVPEPRRPTCPCYSRRAWFCRRR